MVRPHSSLLVATLYLGPMGSLWTYIEGMDVPCLLVTGANGSDLAAWAGFGTLALLEDVYSSCMLWCGPILLCLLQHCIWAPWEAFGHILKEWMSLVSFSRGQTAPIWLPGPGLALWPSLKTFTPPVCYGAAPFFSACCNIVFGPHGKPLDIY